MPTLIEIRRDDLLISTDPARLQPDTVCDLLAGAYWAENRPRERTIRALQNSLVFGLYAGDRQVGLARVVSDYAIFAYLCDVIVHPDYRSRGLGKWLIRTVLSHPDLHGLRRWLLTTRDAHGLYRQFGFELMDPPDHWMQIFHPTFPENS